MVDNFSISSCTVTWLIFIYYGNIINIWCTWKVIIICIYTVQILILINIILKLIHWHLGIKILLDFTELNSVSYRDSIVRNVAYF